MFPNSPQILGLQNFGSLDFGPQYLGHAKLFISRGDAKLT